MKNFHKDLIWSVFLIVLSIAIYCYSGTFDSTSEAVHPLAKSSVYSRIWAVILFILSLILLLRTLRKRNQIKGTPLLTFASIVSVTALVLYLYGLNYLGFAPCTAVFLTVLITYYHWLALNEEERKNARMMMTAMKYFLMSVILTIIFYFVFGRVLSVYLPVGSLIESLIY